MRSLYALHLSLSVAIPTIQPRLRLSGTNRLHSAFHGGQRKPLVCSLSSVLALSLGDVTDRPPLLSGKSWIRKQCRYLCRPGSVGSAMVAGSGMLLRYRSPGSAVAPPVSVCSQAPGIQHPVDHRP
ncbi:MAG: hypothetical protein KZQ59_18460, partial [Candidatus Thiodiazotropha sp. (ex Lucinoma aequizonata)]|nr:hypothetical protein [Candidatus Thiodiazotropha sp. (ex Lucinoma aequizonata)]MCU7900381.1 hypothetical protein [Candidatus Thiodiazotropha sp. (ex Lucinoma aequizonata)]MCU7908129.1 hypothetical protein [Candidatus Thiodiazotropha sp. (ex Lucinoma aequizonata)]MCU7913142.1 hypothetical protein [Candidatus Thiodiazotropha sp. (ex Lucinoma aequizonata)]